MVPDRWAEYYLGNAPSLVWLVGTNLLAVLVGLRFYVAVGPGLGAVPTFLLPLYTDSPTAVLLAAFSLVTLLPNLGRRAADAPVNLPLAYLHTLAFVWLVKYGVWTAIALNVRPELYFGLTGAALWDYWGIIVTHLAFVLEAAVIPHYGATTRGALAFALAALLVTFPVLVFAALQLGATVHGLALAPHYQFFIFLVFCIAAAIVSTPTGPPP